MYESLMEEAVQEENMAQALAAVKRNQGAPGIDHMTTAEIESHLQAHWPKIRAKLLAGAWVPSPVEAGRETEAGRRHADAGNPDGDGPGDSADAVASADADL